MDRFPANMAIRGGGLAAFTSAIALKRAFPTAAVTILLPGNERVAEYPGAATPSIRHFHRQIGLDDRIFTQRTGARTVHQCEWQVLGRAAVSIHPLSTLPFPEGVGIHHLWRALDPSVRPEWTEIVPKFQNDFDRAEGFGIRFDASAYLELLSEMATHLKIGIAGGGYDERAGFDLVVDARAVPAGDGNRMPAQVPTADGGDRIVIERGNAAWTTSHWQLHFASMPEGRSIDRPWSGNHLHIGQTALAIESFDGHALCAAMADILRAISLMPARSGSQAEVAEYNRRTSAIHAMLVDWHSAKWQASQDEGLRQLMTQFAHRGRIPFRDEDPVSVAEWTNWLLSTGTLPAHVDASASSVSQSQILDIFGIV